MRFNPQVDDLLVIGDAAYSIAEHPGAPDIPYGQEGRQAVVYQLVTEIGEKRALKVFKSRYRLPVLVSLADKIARFSTLPGLQVCERTVLTARRHGVLLRQFPGLIYAVLMPWIEGPTWMQVIGERVEFSPKRSLMLAQGLADILVQMEESGLAHCDLSGSNVMLPMLAGEEGLQLVDVEQTYAPGLQQPEVLPGGSPGYAHKRSFQGVWGRSADRFAGAVLLAEMLGWCDERVRQASWGESYFAPKEMGRSNERLEILGTTLRGRWGKRVASLFERAWCSEALADCPTFGEWLVAVPQKVPHIDLVVERAATRVHDQETQERSKLPDSEPPDRGSAKVDGGERDHLARLFDDALGAYRARSWGESKELFAEVVRAEPDYHRGGKSAAKLLGKAQANLRRTGQSGTKARWMTAAVVGVVGTVILVAASLGWRHRGGLLTSVFASPTVTLAMTPTQGLIPVSDVTPTETPDASVTDAPTPTVTPTATPTTGATLAPTPADTPTPIPPPTDTAIAPSAPISPMSSPTPATSGWIRFSSLEYCVGDECRPLHNGSTISRSQGEIRWRMDLVAPNLNEPNDHGRYYTAGEIGLQVVLGDRKGYIHASPGGNICREEAGDRWLVHDSRVNGIHSCGGYSTVDEFSFDVRNLPDWAASGTGISPAVSLHRRDYVDGSWVSGVDAHWELGTEIRISLSD